jgi:hypothetical protein
MHHVLTSAGAASSVGRLTTEPHGTEGWLVGKGWPGTEQVRSRGGGLGAYARARASLPHTFRKCLSLLLQASDSRGARQAVAWPRRHRTRRRRSRGALQPGETAGRRPGKKMEVYPVQAINRNMPQVSAEHRRRWHTWGAGVRGAPRARLAALRCEQNITRVSQTRASRQACKKNMIHVP